MRPRRLPAVALLTGLHACGCAAVLGIEDATLRPEDAGAEGGGTGGSGGSGGVAGSGGEMGSGGASGAGGGTDGGGNPVDAAMDAQGDAAVEAGIEAGPPPTLCETYCETVMANCTGDLAVYESMNVCLATCDTLPPGDDENDLRNTVQCRLVRAKLAADFEPETNCPIAGPGGTGPEGAEICGTNCDGYCSTVIPICPGAFDSRQDCLDVCAGVPDLGPYNSGITTGDSVQCRLYHSGAATQDAVTHCRHAIGVAICTPDPG